MYKMQTAQNNWKQGENKSNFETSPQRVAAICRIVCLALYCLHAFLYLFMVEKLE